MNRLSGCGEEPGDGNGQYVFLPCPPRMAFAQLGCWYLAEVISHCVAISPLHHRFPLSFGEGEEMMLALSVVVSSQTIRQWCQKFGQTSANGLCRRPRPGDKWHLGEVFISPPSRLPHQS